VNGMMHPSGGVTLGLDSEEAQALFDIAEGWLSNYGSDQTYLIGREHHLAVALGIFQLSGRAE
jgi:hypothetical protein